MSGMEVEAKDQPPARLRLGPIERWMLTGALGFFTWSGYKFIEKLDSIEEKAIATNEKMIELKTTVNTLNQQFADYPNLKLEVAKHGMRLDNVEKDVSELKQIKGAR